MVGSTPLGIRSRGNTVILSEAKDLAGGYEILRFAQDDSIATASDAEWG
jgi:hypothetical protein